MQVLVNGEDVEGGPCDCEEVVDPANRSTGLSVEDTFYGIISIYGQTGSVTLLTDAEFESRGFDL